MKGGGRKHTPQTECGSSQESREAGEAPGLRGCQFLYGGQIYRLMSGRSWPAILGGRDGNF